MTAVQQTVEQQARKPFTISRWTWLYLLLALVVGGPLAFNLFRPIVVLPRITLGPGYSLIDHTDTPFNNEMVRGQMALYSFSYANCDDDCPLSGADLADLARQMEDVVPVGMEVALVTLSLDPERDTPSALAAQMADIAPEQSKRVAWRWLTGDALRMKYVVGGGFGLFYKPTDETPDYDVRFEPRYVLVDSLGIIRAYYNSAEIDLDILERDINYIINETANSTGAARIAYEAAHLFACYPR